MRRFLKFFFIFIFLIFQIIINLNHPLTYPPFFIKSVIIPFLFKYKHYKIILILLYIIATVIEPSIDIVFYFYSYHADDAGDDFDDDFDDADDYDDDYDDADDYS